jgi:AraC-like DNA-binding protein
MGDDALYWTISNQKFKILSLSFKMTVPARLDRLSAVLEGAAPQIHVCHTGEAPVATQYAAERANMLRLHLVTQGQAWISAGDDESKCLSAPAIAVLRGDRPYVLTPDANAADGAAPTCQMCVEVRFEGPAGTLLLEAFSRPLLMPLDDSAPELALIVKLIAYEVVQPRCGHPALLARAGDILFIGLLRHLIANRCASLGLLNGLSNRHIAGALVAMHSAPHLPWTLDTLAQKAGMSRTAFAVLFRQMMDRPPGSYLAQLRLSIARRLVDNGHGLKRAAKDAGYASTTALSRALGRMHAAAD